MPLPRCELGAGQAAYPGRWTAHSRVPPYSLNSTVWAQLGMNEIRDAKGAGHKHDWGRCAKTRQLFDWNPTECELLPFDREDVCRRRIFGQQALFVGDSTTAQLFTSFVLLLGGAFGRNRVRGSTMVMVTASACNDEVRLSFVRSDLLLWTHDQTETKAVARCDAILFNYRWAQQAILDADVLVLGIGQHFSSKIYHAPPKLQHKVYAFFTGNLNRTLSSLRTLRASHGRNDPSSVVVVGASLPMPRCERVARPMTLTEAMASEAAGATMHAYGPSYWHSMRLNQLAQWVARDKGASFLDLATLSIMRGDDSLVRGRNEAPSPTVGYAQADCMHYCLPGVVDTFSQLLYNLFERRAANFSTAASRGEPIRRFFSTANWLTERGAARRLETCNRTCHNTLFASVAPYSSYSWWPWGARNNCSLHLERRKWINFLQTIPFDQNQTFAFYRERQQQMNSDQQHVAVSLTPTLQSTYQEANIRKRRAARITTQAAAHAISKVQLKQPDPGQFAPHKFLLDQAARELGLPAGVGRVTSFAEKLERGEPVTIVILGASVAENSGCFSQPGKRCMANRGVEPVNMVWGEPRRRPFKGFAVRFFEWLNATWPNPKHQLFNAGRDASSLATIAPCLFSHLPPSFDLILIEAGSMFETTKGFMLEKLTRQLLSMRIKPAVVFLTVHLWCTYGGSLRKRTVSYGINALPKRVYRFWPGPHLRVGLAEARKDAFEGNNPSDVLENNITIICKHYSIGCISQRDALLPSAARLSVEEVAGDCLHPVHGSKGTEFITDLLVHWLMRTMHNLRRGAGDAAAAGTTVNAVQAPMGSSSHKLPLPIDPHRVSAIETQKAACYHLGQGFGRAGSVSALPWHTASCATIGASENGALSLGDNPMAAFQTAACTHVDMELLCPASYRLIDRGGNALPPVWTYCTHSVSTSSTQSRKPSPGVVAFKPGATLLIPLPTEWLTIDGSGSSGSSLQGGASAFHFNATLQYVISWRLMGSVRIRCTDSCTCTEHTLDAHVSSWTRNSTIFTEHRVPITFNPQIHPAPASSPTSASCGLLLTLLPGSSSGGHMFRLRDVVLYVSSSPCNDINDKMHKKLRHILSMRSNLRCKVDDAVARIDV